MERIGQIKQVWRYPVKSMRGERLSQAYVSYSGINGDRAWSLMQTVAHHQPSALTARQQAELLLYQPSSQQATLLNHPQPNVHDYTVEVETPEGERYDAQDPAFLAQLERRFQRQISITFSERGMQDDRPLSLLGMRTIHQLKMELDQPIDPLRFRENIYVDWDERRGFYENELLGRPLRIGQHVDILINQLNTRCKIVSLNPATAERDDRIHHHIKLAHDNKVGVYAVILKPGLIEPGDAIYLLS